METTILQLIPIIILLALAFWAIFQYILNTIHKPYLDDCNKVTNVAKVYIYQRGRAPGSYNCFSFRKKGSGWRYIPDKQYLGRWLITYIISLICFLAVFLKLEIPSARSVFILIVAITILFLLLVVFELFLSYLTLIKLLRGI